MSAELLIERLSGLAQATLDRPARRRQIPGKLEIILSARLSPYGVAVVGLARAPDGRTCSHEHIVSYQDIADAAVDPLVYAVETVERALDRLAAPPEGPTT